VDTYSDTWVATDALGRALPTTDAAGPPRAGKTVGIFYFLWLGRHGEQGPFDISKILAEDPTAINNPASPLWGPMHVLHHWGQPLLDYYISDDDFVLRKHAQMLTDAGVDMVVFDVTNQLTYPRAGRPSAASGTNPAEPAIACPRLPSSALSAIHGKLSRNCGSALPPRAVRGTVVSLGRKTPDPGRSIPNSVRTNLRKPRHPC